MGRYRKIAEDGSKFHSVIKHLNADGVRDLRKLGGLDAYFDFPKPVSLIRDLVLGATFTSKNREDIILDFFSGSGTTAQAVMEANAVDGGNRRFILVQIPEPLAKGVAQDNHEFGTIADVSRERIKRAGGFVATDLAMQPLKSALPIDLGFRSYQLSETCFTEWHVSSDVEVDALQQRLLSLRDSATDDASADDLLTEILLKQGYSLTESVAPAEVGGLDVRVVRDRDGDIAVLAYLNEHVKPTLEQLRAFVEESPMRIIVLEDAFQGDDELKTNLAQLARAKGVEVWTA
ncbi:DNA methyltransferase [Scrofimicrobium sp. R131]|uniref:DNA methyltransferase n=1 Tax=Scrofimicrobium appendicitidis TaxID=3079930 RepID=A0AAU7V770_9ACTO